jgi:asparagine synthase (glutamine-hydrolysing)
MCGIGGAVAPDNRGRLTDAVGRLSAALQHRGPDDEGIEILEAPGRTAVLCARRLAIQDLSSHGHQPMKSPETGSCICFNGELYNAADLRASLEVKGYRFRGSSDTEVTLRAYDAWGANCIERLRGMYAIAIWDAPQQRLFLARDRLGIKPLYYTQHHGGVWFASELRALLASGVAPRNISLEGLGSYLALGAVQEPLTIVDGIHLLPAGHYAFVDAEKVTPIPYWSLSDAFSRSARFGSRRDLVDHLRSLLEDAIHRHLVSDVPLGVFLSGGIDSSALVGLVTRVTGRPPHTVSVVFPQRRWSEEPFIRPVVERFGTPHTEVVLSEAEVLVQVPGALSAMDQPTFDGVNTYVVSKQARAAGLTVALSGVGGDELFAGYDTFQMVPRLETLRRLLPASIRPLAAAATRTALRDSDRGRKLARWLAATEPSLSAATLRRELFSPAALAALLGGLSPFLGHPELAIFPGDTTNRVSFLELDHYMRNVLLRDADVFSMAHGLEVRVPFLDHELVELVAGLPGELKGGGTTPKPLLVEAVIDLLPPSSASRPKMGFALPFPVWLRGPLRTRVESTLLDPDSSGPLADLLDHVAVRHVWDRFQDGKTEWVRPWSIYVLKTWVEENLSAAAAPVGR